MTTKHNLCRTSLSLFYFFSFQQNFALMEFWKLAEFLNLELLVETELVKDICSSKLTKLSYSFKSSNFYYNENHGNPIKNHVISVKSKINDLKNVLIFLRMLNAPLGGQDSFY